MADKFDDPLLRQWQDDKSYLPHAAEWYARVQELREMADYYEASLLRGLYHGHGLNWREVADVMNANLGSRQAARQKWQRLISGDGYPHTRRKPGGSGTWPRGVPRKRSDQAE